MTDTFTKTQRSDIMRRVRGRDTSIELLLRQAVWKLGARGYRIGPRHVPGAPDLAFARRRVAVFVDGCFWHGCPRHCRRPSSNKSYWIAKIDRNIERDRRHAALLRRAGWRVVRIWEHEVRSDPERAARRVFTALQAQEKSGRSLKGRLHSTGLKDAPAPKRRP